MFYNHRRAVGRGKWAQEANSPLTLEVEHDSVEEDNVSLGRSEELANLGNPKAGLECLPDVRSEAIANGQPDLMLGVGDAGRKRREIAADLSAVQEDGALVLNHVIEKVLRGEFAPQNQGRRGAHHDAHTN